MVELFTVEEVATMLRVSTKTVRAWRYSGKMQAIQLPGGSLRVSKEEVDRLLSTYAVPA